MAALTFNPPHSEGKGRRICCPTGPTLFQRTRGSTWASPMAYVPLPANPLSQPAEETTRLGLCICREETFAFFSSHFLVVSSKGKRHCPPRHWFLTNVTCGFGGPLCRDSVALRCLPPGCIRQRGTMVVFNPYSNSHTKRGKGQRGGWYIPLWWL